ncbi:hypothetical protein [Ochrobactrum teleogrylli]|nr:hypothetical protein [Ochrobactrum sp. C6C9]
MKKVILAWISLASFTNVAPAVDNEVCKERARSDCTNKPELVKTTFDACFQNKYKWCMAEKFQPGHVK